MGMMAAVSMKQVNIQRASSKKRKANSDPFQVNIGSPKKR